MDNEHEAIRLLETSTAYLESLIQFDRHRLGARLHEIEAHNAKAYDLIERVRGWSHRGVAARRRRHGA